MYSLQALQKQVNEKRHLFIIGKYENVDVGFTSYELNYKSSSTKIHKLYVLPSCQGKGLGKRFVEEIAISALHNNNDKLLLNVNKKNPAILFYEKIGFRQVAQETISIGNGYVMDDYVMEKSLT
jgi:ribosomal protein S18 acetylase RimI-like enzyme